jgi:hypothetical protein
MERALRLERIIVGLAAARARGRKDGRRLVVNPEAQSAQSTPGRWSRLGRPFATQPHALGVSRTTLYRALGLAEAARPGVVRFEREPGSRSNSALVIGLCAAPRSAIDRSPPEPALARWCIPTRINCGRKLAMKHLLVGATALGLLAGVAMAQGVPGSGSSTTTETTGPNGSSTTTTKQGTSWNGNSVTKQDSYKEGISGSSETHSKTETDSTNGGTTTSKTTTTKPQ